MFPVIFFLLSLIVAHSLAIPIEKRGSTTIQLNSDSAFCSFLPPNPGDKVGETEEHGKPFCTSADLSNEGRVFPHEFIRSAHFVKKSTYIQVTGRMDRSKYNLKSSDGGGQYDNKDVHDVTCNGYKYWVNMLEPDVNHYCIRCCQQQKDCNLGISTYGCERVVPGDYS